MLLAPHVQGLSQHIEGLRSLIGEVGQFRVLKALQ